MYWLTILSYNHPEITARCVSSVLQFLPAAQVKLVHNGSEAKHVRGLKEKFPQIEHWEFSPNRGYSGGVNQMLNRAFVNVDWVFVLTNDTEISKWKLDVGSLGDGIFSPMVWLKRKMTIDYVGGVFQSSKAKLVHLKVPNANPLKVGEFRYVPGTAFLISKKFYARVGAFDESLHTYWEDVDFGARLTKLNLPIGYLSDIEILHQGGRTTRKDPFYTSHLFRSNRRQVSWRHCPWFLKPILFLRLTFYQGNRLNIARLVRWRSRR